MRCASSICWRWKTEMLPLLGLMPDPLVLRCHVRWTKVMVLRAAMRLAVRRRGR